MTTGVEGTEWREISCPQCGVRPGELCVSRSGNPARPHTQRLFAAKARKDKPAIAAPAYDTPETVAEKCKVAREVMERFAELCGGRKP